MYGLSTPKWYGHFDNTNFNVKNISSYVIYSFLIKAKNFDTETIDQIDIKHAFKGYMTFRDKEEDQFYFLRDISLDIKKMIENLGANVFERVKYLETST